jgi:hypothetical protein
MPRRPDHAVLPGAGGVEDEGVAAWKLPNELFLMAVGWLTREGKLSFVKEGRVVKLRLKKGAT